MEAVNFVVAAEIPHSNGKYSYPISFGDRKEVVDVIPRIYNVYRHQTMILASNKVEGLYKPFNPEPN